ncbi:LOW QUALITY PROTEIN: hypothetical protein QTO34_007588, partial [Cnephaeus nilssonii]
MAGGGQGQGPCTDFVHRASSKKNKILNHVVQGGPNLNNTLKPKKVKTLSGNRIKSNQISKLQKGSKCHNYDAHCTTASPSPARSPVMVTSQKMAQINKWLRALTECQ